MKYSINVNLMWLTDVAIQFNSFVIFCLLDLLLTDRRVLKSTTIIVDLSISQFYTFLPHALMLCC